MPYGFDTANGWGRVAVGKSKKNKLEILSLARRAAAKLREVAITPTRRLRICEQLLNPNGAQRELRELAGALASLELDAQHYWIGTFYTLLLSAPDRRAQAAYFTPPHLARAVIGLAQKAGFDLRAHSVVDPAAGGAAFLSMIAGQMRVARAQTGTIIKRLAGMEIDSGLARLAERLISERLGAPVAAGSIITHRDSLSLRTPEQFDLVIANPPYGRILDDPAGHRWKQVCHAGHINKFALFAELCLRLAKPNGLVALVLPSSFVAGPLYDKLRGHIRKHSEVLTVASVTDREDLFLDVQQDITVLLLRAGNQHVAERTVTFGEFSGARPFKVRCQDRLPAALGAAWSVPTTAVGQAVGGFTLSDYNAEVRAGYFVWNREQDRMRTRCYSERDVPLIWAENIRAGVKCTPRARSKAGIDFVAFEKGASERPIIRGPAAVLQRTTNSSQPRRLIAARVAPAVVDEWGGFVTENHTIVLTAKDVKILDMLCVLLNSRAVDDRYRRLSGTASISVKLLRTLDLPDPQTLRRLMAEMDDVEAAVEKAYSLSAAQSRAAAA
jgi:adenine-specific DNA-methyltransferase